MDRAKALVPDVSWQRLTGFDVEDIPFGAMSSPETSASRSGGSAPAGQPSFFKQWGPFVAVGVAAVLAAGAVVFGFLTSDEEVILEAPTTTVAQPEESGPSIPYPLSFSEAKAQGSVETIDWGDRCDTETGRLAVPDLFAPECMAPFVGDNGGATSPGVGVGTVKIVYYMVADNDPIRSHVYGAARIDDTGEQQSLALADFMKYYDQFYELYGRSIELVIYESKAAANDETAARADAQRIAEEIRPFAVVGGPALTNAFAEELAGRGVVCIDCGTGSTQWFKDRAPYLWSTDASGTQKQIHLTEFVQKQLVGKPAAFAGEELRAAPRVFAHVYLDRGPESGLLAEQLIGRLEAVAARPVETIPYTLEPEKMKEKATEIITKLKAAGVTTVILSTDPATPVELTREAFTQKYFPEWLVAAAPLVDSSTYGRAYVPKQWEHAFGVSSLAVRTAAAEGNYYSLYEWYVGRPPYADDTIDTIMPSFAFLLSVIQSTGPNLTPETFADTIRTLATQATTTRPFYRWGDHDVWEDGDFSGVEDAALFWWDVAGVGADERRREGTGLVRFADGGKRYLPGEWPGEERLFVEAGSVLFLNVPAPEDEVRSYPSPLTVGTTVPPVPGAPPSSVIDSTTSSSSVPTSSVPAGTTTTASG